MLSKRDNLLIRPWQQRKYDNHRKKVQSALPAIDTKPPIFREHVAVKLKKKQKENERCKKIERENCLLLQKMNYIMKTSRVDNYWRTPQPRFLNKVAMFDLNVPQIEDINLLNNDQIEELLDNKLSSRKSKCYACTPKVPEEIQIPEERVPWEPEKRPVGRIRSKSVPVRRTDPLPIIKETQTSTSAKSSSSKISNNSQRAKTSITKDEKPKITLKKLLSLQEPQSIVLTRGCLKLCVNFPSDTSIKFQDGRNEKFLLKGLCSCKNTPSTLEIF